MRTLGATLLFALAVPACTAARAATTPADRPSTVRFVAAPPAAEIRIGLDGPKLLYQLVLEASAASRDVRVETTDLVGPERVALECRAGTDPCSTPFAMRPGAAKAIQLQATVASAGTYTAVVSIVRPGQRQSTQLVVTRTASAFPAELAASAPSGISEGGKATLVMALQERNNAEANLHLPSLVLLRRELGKAPLADTGFSVRWRRHAGPLRGDWKLAKRESQTLFMEVDGLDAPGEYVGRVRFTSRDSPQVLDVPVSIVHKRSAWLAAGLIALGALLSFVLRSYLRGLRPRLLLQQDAAMLEHDLAALREDAVARFAPLQQEEVAVLDALAAQLAQIRRGLFNGPAAKGKAQLEAVDAKLSIARRWLNARRRADALQAAPAAALQTVIGIGERLQARDALPEDSAKELAALEQEIGEAELTELDHQRDRLADAVKKSVYLAPVVQEGLLQEVQAAVGVDLAMRRRRLAQSEAKFLDTQVKGLESTLQQKPPAGFPEAAWARLAGEVLTLLQAAESGSPRERAQAFRQAARQYLSALLQNGLQRVEQRDSALASDPNIQAEARKQLREQLQEARKLLQEAQAQLDTDQLDDAAVATRQATERLREIEAQMPRTRFLGPGAAPADAAAKPAGTADVPQGLDLLPAGVVLLHLLGQRIERFAQLPAARLGLLVGRLDWAVLVAALLVSVLLGLKLLWVDNPTWGSANDWMLAVLWGLGLHQVANTAFDGIGGVAERFAK